jgi:sec-independent protein translocase protein TatC
MRLRDAIRSVGHDETLPVIGHLDELRTRIIVSLAALAVAFGFCFWQNNALLHLLNRPLASQTQKQVRAGEGPLGATYAVARGARDVALQLRDVVAVLASPGSGVGPSARVRLARSGVALSRDVADLSKPPTGDKPITLGIGEPFTTTVTVSLVFALILTLPVLLMQAIGFLAPALDREQQRGLVPVTLAIPILFVTGVAFGYFVVLPAAVRFFQNFNSDQFNVLVQASQYYKFAATTLLAMGVLFQVPVAIMAVTRAGIVTPRGLRRNRRYAVAACAAAAALLPGDAVTMLLETVPLYLLFEVSLLVATIAERRSDRALAAAAA